MATWPSGAARGARKQRIARRQFDEAQMRKIREAVQALAEKALAELCEKINARRGTNENP